MSNIEFNPGDKVFHKSDYTTIWIIEMIEENEVFCSTLLKDSKKLIKEKFSPTSIEKVETNSNPIFIGNKTRNNHFWYIVETQKKK